MGSPLKIHPHDCNQWSEHDLRCCKGCNTQSFGAASLPVVTSPSEIAADFVIPADMAKEVVVTHMLDLELQQGYQPDACFYISFTCRISCYDQSQKPCMTNKTSLPTVTNPKSTIRNLGLLLSLYQCITCETVVVQAVGIWPTYLLGSSANCARPNCLIP